MIAPLSTNRRSRLPWSRAHMPWQNRIKSDWDRPRHPDLTPMSVTTHKQIKTAMCGLAEWQAASR